jgi:hypothetical protein
VSEPLAGESTITSERAKAPESTKRIEPLTENEKLLLVLLEHCPDSIAAAIVLQSFIADCGPLSEEVGEKVRTILSNTGAR